MESVSCQVRAAGAFLQPGHKFSQHESPQGIGQVVGDIQRLTGLCPSVSNCYKSLSELGHANRLAT